MAVNFANVTDITIPQGNLIKIQETNGGRVLWEKRRNYFYPPKILPGQVFDVYVDKSVSLGYVEADNVYSFSDEEVSIFISEISWSCDNLPDGMSMNQRGAYFYFMDTTPYNIGTFKVKIKVITRFGSDEEYITINSMYSSDAAKPTIIRNQEFYVVRGKSMPRYAILYESAMPLNYIDYNYQWNCWGRPIDYGGISYDAYKGSLYSSIIGWDSEQMEANKTVNYYPDVVSYNIRYPNDPNNPYPSLIDMAYVRGSVVIYTLSSVMTVSDINDVQHTVKLVLCGIPEALLRVGGSADLDFLWVSDDMLPTYMYAYTVIPSLLTLSGSSNLTISGRRVTVNSSGNCSISASTPRHWSNLNSLTRFSVSWSAKDR